MQHLSNRLDADYIRHFAPEVIARVVIACTRGAVSGDQADHVTREALIDAWMAHKGFETRPEAIADLMSIEIERYVNRSLSADSRP